MKTVEITYRYHSAAVAERARPADAESARVRLDDGNRAFAALLDSLDVGRGTVRRVITVDPRDFGGMTRDRVAPVQQPFAAVLGCSDARVPVELIFNEGPNDLFVVRVAGNGLGDEVLGSLKYAADHLGGSMKLVVVLGHSGCGAVSAAVDVFLDPSRYLGLTADHALRTILDRLLIVVHASSSKLQQTFGGGVTKLPSYREALIESAIVLNAALTAHTVQHALHDEEQAAGPRASYGTYVIATRRIWAPRTGSSECDGLASPPVSAAGFLDLADAIVASPRIGELIAGDDATRAPRARHTA
jgi:carbonic anhydrase